MMIGRVVIVVSTVVADELEVVEIFFFLGRLLIASLFLAYATAVVVVVVDAPFSKHLTTLPFSSTHPTKNVDFPPLYIR